MFSDGKGIFDIIIVGEDDFEFLFEFMVNYIFGVGENMVIKVNDVV